MSSTAGRAGAPGRNETGRDDTGRDDTGRDDTGRDDTGRDDTGRDDTGPDDTVETITVYEAVGGMPYFVELVDDFYDRVEADPVLRPLYPEDLTESRRRTALFLGQFWGGPQDYSDERGHPRLRMRHLPFTIGQAERDAWLEHMMAAVRSSAVDGRPLHPVIVEMFENYFEHSSTAMINS